MAAWDDIQQPVGDIVGWAGDIVGAISGAAGAGNPSAEQPNNQQPVNVTIEVQEQARSGPNPWFIGGAVALGLLLLR